MAVTPKKLFLETVGCQMNVLDSELVLGALQEEGYALTDSIGQADVVLFNTCSVRQHAEDKIYSALGRLKHRKKKNPDLVIGVMGCMAQKDQSQIFHRAPHVDLVAGPGQLAKIPALVRQAQSDRGRQLAVSLPRTGGSRQIVADSFEEYDPDRLAELRPAKFQAFLRIMMGCDKFCTFCVVPSVRGPEQSRTPESIVNEAAKLAADGCVELTLLGQTVNSYRFRHGDGRNTRFSDLLERIHQIDGPKRIKFITNYPRDMTDDLLQAVQALPKISAYFHVPLQHGSNAVLKRMKRGYSVEEYEEMLQRLRQTVPNATVSSDFIVGFCGETDREHQASVELLERCRFKNSFVFKYSERPGTKAHGTMKDDVREITKKQRNNELLQIQNRISLEENRQLIGRELEVLVEGQSKSAAKSGESAQLTGRTSNDRIVVFPGTPRLKGSFARVQIDAVTPTTLIGSVPDAHSAHDKGLAATRDNGHTTGHSVVTLRPIADRPLRDR